MNLPEALAVSIVWIVCGMVAVVCIAILGPEADVACVWCVALIGLGAIAGTNYILG